MHNNARMTAIAHDTPHIDLEWNFGDRVRKVRRSHGLSQGEMAARIGETTAAVSAWETYVSTPRHLLAVAKRIDEEFGLPAGWMLGYASAPTPPGGQTGQLLRLDSNQQPLDNCVADGHLATVLPFPSRADLNVPAATAFSQTPAIG